MEKANEMFSGKLAELEGEYAQMIRRLRQYAGADHCQVRRELQTLRQEFREGERLLGDSARTGRSPAVSALSAAQQEYDQRIRRLLEEDLLGYLHEPGSTPAEDRVEAAGLYGEYAVDFAVQTMRHALMAVLSAMDLEMTWEERKTKDASVEMEESSNE